MSSIIEKYSRALKLYRDDGISVPVLPSEMRTLIADFLALKEQCAALESREVCTVAHENVETCGYCQRDALAARLAEAERDAERWRKAQDAALLIYDRRTREAVQDFLKVWSMWKRDP